MYRSLRASLIVLLLAGFSYPAAWAQSCCSGGVPVSSNLGLPGGEKGVLQWSLAYDLNVLNTLQDGRRRLDDRSRNRSTHSVLAELGYTWSKRWSTDLFFSYIQQERTITQGGRQTDFDRASGLGDAVVLVKYRLLYRERGATSFYLGLGAKLPLGGFDRVDERGILLSADLQPGSGAWDGIFWGQLSQQLAFRPSMNVVATTTIALKGENPVFNTNETYAFGDEWLLALGLSDRIFVAKQLFDPSLLLRYRTVRADFRNDTELPSTGGQWLFLNPSLSWWLGKDVSVNANFEIPIFADLEGTQATPSYRINLGLYWRLARKGKEPRLYLEEKK
ncbi:MAG: transporter [Bacteroidota bacterium]